MSDPNKCDRCGGILGIDMPRMDNVCRACGMDTRLGDRADADESALAGEVGRKTRSETMNDKNTDALLESLANRLADKAYRCPNDYVGNLRSSVLLEVATTILQELSGDTPEQVAATEQRAKAQAEAKRQANPAEPR